MKRSLFERIEKPELLVEHVVEQITTAILNGELHPGDKLVEEKLGAQLGVSRVPVREALRQLELLGLVEKQPYHGTFVSQIEERDIVELHELRLVLESLAARSLGQQPTPEIAVALNQIIEDMQQAAAQNDRRRMIELDADFHDALIRLSGNKLLNDVWEPVSVKMRRFMMLKRFHTHKTIEAVIPPHQAIVEKIAAADPEGAEKAVQAHLARVEKRFREVVHEGQPLT